MECLILYVSIVMNRDWDMSDWIFIGGGGVDYVEGQYFLLEYVNCYGLIVGVIGMGKIVML